ncbi:MAG: DNA-binding MarR family transcriptional regulator [Paracoccaceae bacterium]|jgi:DNA-binding MarR family transcriptional regulator
MTNNSPPQRPESLGRYVNFASAATNALCNSLLSEHGLTLQQWVVLSALWQNKELSVSEVADYTGNAGPATSRILDRMFEKGLVGRRQDTLDRRSSKVFLEPKGEALRPLQGFFEKVNDILSQGMTKAEIQSLYTLLERVSDNAHQFEHRSKADRTAGNQPE